jgi:hypothetical protein
LLDSKADEADDQHYNDRLRDPADYKSKHFLFNSRRQTVEALRAFDELISPPAAKGAKPLWNPWRAFTAGDHKIVWELKIVFP